MADSTPGATDRDIDRDLSIGILRVARLALRCAGCGASIREVIGFDGPRRWCASCALALDAERPITGHAA